MNTDKENLILVAELLSDERYHIRNTQQTEYGFMNALEHLKKRYGRMDFITDANKIYVKGNIKMEKIKFTFSSYLIGNEIGIN